MVLVRNTEAANKRWRPGQAVFNTLIVTHPMLAEEIRGSNFDPFHAFNESDPQYKAALALIRERLGGLNDL